MPRSAGIGKKQPRMLTIAQAAEQLGLHPKTVRKWADQGILPVVRLGPRKDRRFAREDIHRFVQSR